MDDLVKIAQDSGFGNTVGPDGACNWRGKSGAGVPVGPVAEIGREVAPTSGVVLAAEHMAKCAKKNHDAPRVGPPEKGDPIPEDTPGLVTVACPCIFQTGAAYFHAKRPVEATMPLSDSGRDAFSFTKMADPWNVIDFVTGPSIRTAASRMCAQGSFF